MSETPADVLDRAINALVAHVHDLTVQDWDQDLVYAAASKLVDRLWQGAIQTPDPSDAMDRSVTVALSAFRLAIQELNETLNHIEPAA